MIVNKVNSSSCDCNEADLHRGVVEADKVCEHEEVHVPTEEHHQEQDLRLAGHQGAAPCLPDLAGEKEYGEKVRQVSEEPENTWLIYYNRRPDLFVRRNTVRPSVRR